MSEFVSAGLTAGQLNALVKNIMKETGIADPQKAVRSFNADEWGLSPTSQFLNNPKKYWSCRKGLWVSASVSDFIVPSTKDGGIVDVSSYCSVDTLRDMFDSEILAECIGKTQEVKDGVFTLDKVQEVIKDLHLLLFGRIELTGDSFRIIYFVRNEIKKLTFTLNQIRSFIDAQWDGKEGKLLVNGCTNSFYFMYGDGPPFAIIVSWRNGGWHVDGNWSHKQGRRQSGSRIFFNKP
jgi:hypothetical protein